jgi:uncharacterized glyoxalase superfamily protein PhnB
MTVHELFAYLRLENASKAIDFYREAFGAKGTSATRSRRFHPQRCSAATTR